MLIASVLRKTTRLEEEKPKDPFLTSRITVDPTGPFKSPRMSLEERSCNGMLSTARI